MSNNQTSRRDFLRLSGIASAGLIISGCATSQPAADGEAAAPTEAAPGTQADAAIESGDVARDKTLIFMMGGTDGQFTTVGLANPYNSGGEGHRAVEGSMEYLFFFSAHSGEVTPWLATDAEYNEDYTELVVNIRDGVEWSDGTPFTANDVAFTLNMLIDNAPLLRNSTVVQEWVESAEAPDDLTVLIKFYEPRPRFLADLLYGKFDSGLFFVPQHVFQDVEDISAFEFYDPEQGWPLVTGPYNVSDWRPNQQVMARRDDWWAAKTGFQELPDPERLIRLPWSGEERAAQLLIANEIDTSLDLRATTISQVIAQNDAITTYTGREAPYGYIDWWPTSVWFNCDEPPYNDPNVRWAVSYTLDRQQMLNVALEGSGILTELPFPYFEPLMPYVEAAAPLLEQYPTNEHNLDKAAQRMETAGYTKNAEGMWEKDGAPIEANIHGFVFMNDIGPILAEQLRRGGFAADYSVPADSGTRMSEGTAKIMLFGHGGSIVDPFHTMDFYTSKYYRPTGEPAPYFSRYQNPEYDTILEEMAAIPPSPDNPEYMDLYLAGIEIYLRDLIDAPLQQWLHRIPLNTTYWDGWVTRDYVNMSSSFWAQTFVLALTYLESKA